MTFRARFVLAAAYLLATVVIALTVPLALNIDRRATSELESDVVVSYHQTEEEAATALKDKRALAVPAVKEGNVAQVVGAVNVSSVSPPTALSFQWDEGMPALVEKLAAAVK